MCSVKMSVSLEDLQEIKRVSQQATRHLATNNPTDANKGLFFICEKIDEILDAEQSNTSC